MEALYVLYILYKKFDHFYLFVYFIHIVRYIEMNFQHQYVHIEIIINSRKHVIIQSIE